MKVSDWGEFGLIERLARIVGKRLPENVIVGIGDDAAAWRTADGTVLLATTDTLVAGVHFLPEHTPWRSLGWKAMAVNVSDIAAMGGIADFALVTLGVPPEQPTQTLDDLYAGLSECSETYFLSIIGGDVVRADTFMVSVTLLGHAVVDAEGQPRLLRRDGARAGYSLAVTGTLGDSAAGLRRLREGSTASDPLVWAHLQPRPPLNVGQAAARLGLSCAIDISDGLLQDLGHICQGSPDPVGAIVWAERLPISAALRDAYPDEAVSLAASGGEDYQLLLAAPADAIATLAAQIDVPLTEIGELVEDAKRRVRLLDAQSADLTPAVVGWDHLRRA